MFGRHAVIVKILCMCLHRMAGLVAGAEVAELLVAVGISEALCQSSTES